MEPVWDRTDLGGASGGTGRTVYLAVTLIESDEASYSTDLIKTSGSLANASCTQSPGVLMPGSVMVLSPS